MSGRLDRARAVISGLGLDGAVVTHPANRFYLSGFSAGDDAPTVSAALLLGPSSAVLFTGGANVPWARSEAAGFDVRPWSRPWEPVVGEAIRRLGWRRVGFEEQAISFAAHGALAESLSGAAELVPLGLRLDDLRAVKDDQEQATLAEAVRIGDEAFVSATAEVEAGVTERALARRIDDELVARGADGPAFPTIVASGPNAARPHHTPSGRQIATGEPVIIDMGARLRGYHGDLTRTIWVGEPDERLVAVYDVVARANAAARDAIRAGLPLGELHAVARSVIDAAGYGDHLPHGISHGVGVRIHEAPFAAANAKGSLAEGNVITIEPGVYLDGWGGVRLEDVGVVERGGFRLLTTAPKHRVNDGPPPRPVRPEHARLL